MKTLILVIIAVTLTLTTGCSGDDSPAAPDEPQMVDASVEIYYMSVRKSCDGTNGTGDFYSKVEVYHAPTGGTETLLDETGWILKQYEAGPNYPIIEDIIATGTVALVDGQRLRFVIRSFENDPGGVHHAEVAGSYVFVYDASTGCWNDELNPRPCSDTDGTLDRDQNLHMYDDSTSHICDVLVQGKVEIKYSGSDE